jgi:hypothetical protein
VTKVAKNKSLISIACQLFIGYLAFHNNCCGVQCGALSVVKPESLINKMVGEDVSAYDVRFVNVETN